MSDNDNCRYIVQVYVGALSDLYEALSVEASKQTTAEEIVSCIVERLSLNENPGGGSYELAEVIGDALGRECKERSLGPRESPVQVMLLWPKGRTDQSSYRFYLREKVNDFIWTDNFTMDPQLIRDYFYRFLYQPKDREYPDLCQLPDLNEQTLLDNLRARFNAGHIYTYVGSILIAINPFKFYPIYNPKYVKLYQNQRLGPNLPPHIFAVADSAYHCMLKDRKNQCIVISGESGSGKTESTNFLLHHLTALSQKGSHGSGVEQTILSAGPVLEAFGNAKTAHNNNSSRFGKFIQVNYKENGMVHGAVVQKYLLEKSRICSQGKNERNYHVFYYLLQGANEQEKQSLHLESADHYNYLNKSGCISLDNVDEKYEFSRLKQSMEMVGFTAEKQRRLFSVLSAVLLLGNIEFQPRKATYHHDDAVCVKNPEVVSIISELLRVKQETLLQALTSKRARASGETLIINYRMPEAIASRDAMAKCLYGALFDWIVLQVNHALLSKKDTLREHQGNSIGVLDIFGFEDFGLCNSFEQLCINYANEHLQYYFNQHVFNYEQQEYRREGIRWTNIEFMDNTGCLQLVEGKPNGILCILDDQCNFPGATNETLLQKFNSMHRDNNWYQQPQKREAAFIVVHYAGKVKYQVTEMREKNLDLMRQDIVSVLKNSSMAFVRELVGADPVAVFRWAIVRAFFRAYFAFREAGKVHRQNRVDGSKINVQQRYRNHVPNENIISYLVTVSTVNLTVNRIARQRNSLSYGRVADVPYTRQHLIQRTRTTSLGSPLKGGADDNVSITTTTNPNSKPIRDSTGRGYTHSRYSTSSYGRRVLCPDEARVMQLADQIVKKNKSFRPRERGKKGLKNLQSVKTLAGRTGLAAAGAQPGKSRKQPLTVAAQFQQSLHSLMDTLNQANPYFIRCIKSNGNKIPNEFDNDTVQRQLRYTGMLETVRIRQAGFNVRLTYDEFIQLYRILLPKGLLSSQTDVRNFLLTLNLNRDNYQLGTTKVFLRESEKHKLDGKLHQQIMASIITLQRWFRACLERRRFLRLKQAVIALQSHCRMFIVQKQIKRVYAAMKIQRCWRGYKARSWVQKLKQGLVMFQALARGYLVRKYVCQRLREQKEQKLRHKQPEASTKTLCNPLTPPVSVYDQSLKPLNSESVVENGETKLKQNLRCTQSLPVGIISIQSKSIEKERDPQNSWFGDLRKEENVQAYNPYVVSETQPFQRNSIQNSSSDLESPGKQSRNNNNNRLISAIRRRDNWSPILSSRSETDLESGAIASAPAELGGRSSVYEDLWMKHSSSEAEKENQQHSPKNRFLKDRIHTPLKRELRVNDMSGGVIRGSPDGLISLPPVRRRENSDSVRKSELAKIVQTHKEEKLAQTKPEIPLRADRKKSKRDLIRSLGEDVSDSSAIERSLMLGTIEETNDIKRQRSAEIATKLLQSENEWCTLSKQTLTPKRTRSSFTPLDLKRRNSDPATKVTLEHHHGDAQQTQSKTNNELEWKNDNTFMMAGHCFSKAKKTNKDEVCAFCNEATDLFYMQGHKCAYCKKLFHTKCIQNKSVLQMPCAASTSEGNKPGRRKHRKHSRAPYDVGKRSEASKFNLTGTSEFTDSADQIISDAREFELMQDFITSKICKMESEAGKNPSEVDRVFKQALREFKDNLVQIYSTANQHGTGDIKYKDLIANFIHAMHTVCKQEEKDEDFPVTMGVNAFRGFMNEFMTSRVVTEKPSKLKRKKDKKRKDDELIKFAGHRFLLTIINIPTACEICNSFFMWPIERGLVCQSCKLTCHKKCYTKASSTCVKDASFSTSEGKNNKVFGVPLADLLTDDCKIPSVIERLITTIEMYGLYTEGIYRKSGVNSKVRELKARMEENPKDVNFENYQVNVLASVLKSFLREMPEPLLTFECYENFITAAMLKDTQDRVSTLYDILKKLPKPNYDLMERLIFHLARVALHEETNRMSAASLAIVFAPCILRTNKLVPAQDSLHDISSQTQCIETIIKEQLRKVRNTLDDIDTLDTACQAATNRLSSLRSSKVFTQEEIMLPQNQHPDDEEAMLVGHIEEIKKEKEHLASTLPTLTNATSDDDMLSTDLDGEGSWDDVSYIGEQKKPKVKSMSARGSSSGSGAEGKFISTQPPKIKRQNSADIVRNLDEHEDPIMV
ncbi:unconventional myosin-IXa isoform X2 [Agrilus planipennis]|uniref:Unconventional myosin-IXa isoform X2 n=1 Tax=Agrilus planipennis TaxID=224129 RepID=A0A1W4WIS6_AGRPL|nr:unconventional myosin-IXa isoform X2 [Agrilus planipennis]